MNVQKINDVVTYTLVAIMWAPHATKECVDICNGPVFISPTFFAFITPYAKMDISYHGFFMQALWSPVFLVTSWCLFYVRDHHSCGKFFQVYIIRWVFFSLALIILYNVLFWGGLRPFIFPSFIF